MKRLGKIARQYARHSFSIENMVKEYERFQEEVLIAAGVGTPVGD